MHVVRWNTIGDAWADRLLGQAPAAGRDPTTGRWQPAAQTVFLSTTLT